MKILALDIGTVRIGIATSDIMEIIASAYEVYKRKNTDEDVKHIVQIVEDLSVGEIVIGLPLKMDGTRCERGGIKWQKHLEVNLQSLWAFQ